MQDIRTGIDHTVSYSSHQSSPTSTTTCRISLEAKDIQIHSLAFP